MPEVTPEEIARRITGYATLRWDLMKLADEENAIRMKLVEVQTLKNQGITKLVELADRIFTKALPEYDTDGKLKKAYEYAKSPVHGGAAVEAVAEFTNPSRRNCGLCGKPGHTRPNCPDADVIQEEKKAEAAVLDERAKAKAAIAGTGKRACSNCHKPGHRAKNCTEPVVVRRKKKGKK